MYELTRYFSQVKPNGNSLTKNPHDIIAPVINIILTAIFEGKKVKSVISIKKKP